MINTTISLDEIDFTETDPGALLDSIRDRGIAIPVHVVRNNDRFICVDGNKRLTACRILQNEKPGLARVPVFIKGDYSKAGCAFWGSKNHH